MDKILGFVVAIVFISWIMERFGHIILGLSILGVLCVAGLYFYRRWQDEEDRKLREQRQLSEQQSEQETIYLLDRMARIEKHEIEIEVEDRLREIEALVVGSQGSFRVPLEDFIAPGVVAQSLINPIMEHCEFENDLRRTVIDNVRQVSRDKYSDAQIEKGSLLRPEEYEGRDALERYLKGTPFVDRLKAKHVRHGIPDRLRPEHCLMVARTGSGKSQLIEHMVLDDLAQEDPPGILIIDSKGDANSLFNRIPRLDVFHPDHGRLRDRLILIDPVADKPALNMFDVSGELTNEKVNQINASMRYFFGGLLGDELSGQMNTLFLPLLHVILRVPGATLHDLQRLIRDPLQFPDALAQVPPGIRRFLTEEFGSLKSDGFKATKQALVVRIQGIINEVTLDDMFSAPKSAFDVAEALGSGKTIVVSTNAAKLQHVSSIFGKFWIAQMLNAGMTREGTRRIHFYCDEAEPYVDDKILTMLSTIRSYNVGVMLAFQNIAQMGEFAPGILSNTIIKFFSGGDPRDANTLAPFFHGMSSQDLQQVVKRKGYAQFALAHSELHNAVRIGFPFGELDGCFMSDEDYRELRRRNRERLTAPLALPAPEFPETLIEPEAEVAAVPLRAARRPNPTRPETKPVKRKRQFSTTKPDTSGSQPTEEW